MEERVYTNVTAREGEKMAEQQKELVLLDVRQPEEYAAGHIPGSLLIPLPELESRLSELDKDKQYLVICRSGRRSITACNIMNYYGFDKLYNMMGGMLAWEGKVETE